MTFIQNGHVGIYSWNFNIVVVLLGRFNTWPLSLVLIGKHSQRVDTINDIMSFWSNLIVKWKYKLRYASFRRRQYHVIVISTPSFWHCYFDAAVWTPSFRCGNIGVTILAWLFRCSVFDAIISIVGHFDVTIG